MKYIKLSPEEYIESLFDFYTVHLKYTYKVLEFYREAHKQTELSEYTNILPFKAIQKNYEKFISNVFNYIFLNKRKVTLRYEIKKTPLNYYQIAKGHLLTSGTRFIPVISLASLSPTIGLYDIKDGLRENTNTVHHRDYQAVGYLKIPYRKLFNKNLVVTFRCQPRIIRNLMKAEHQRGFNSILVNDKVLKLKNITKDWEKLWIEKYHEETEHYYQEMMKLFKKLFYCDLKCLRDQMFIPEAELNSENKNIITFFSQENISKFFFESSAKYFVSNVKEETESSILFAERKLASAVKTIYLFECETTTLDENLGIIEENRKATLDKIPSRENFIKYVTSVYKGDTNLSYDVPSEMVKIKEAITSKVSLQELVKELYTLDWKKFLYLGSLDIVKHCSLNSFVFSSSEKYIKHTNKFLGYILDSIFKERTVENLIRTVHENPMDCLEVLKIFWILEKHNY